MPKLNTKDGNWKGKPFEKLNPTSQRILEQWGYVINEVQEHIKADNLQLSKTGRRVRSKQSGSGSPIALTKGSETRSETKSSEKESDTSE